MAQESLLDQLLRVGAQTTARTASQALGLPGDIQGLLGGVSSQEEEAPKEEEALLERARLGDKEALVNYLSLPSSTIPKKPIALPTSKQTSKAIKESPFLGKALPKDYLKPRSQEEKSISEGVSDFINYILPYGQIKGVKPVTSLAMAGLGNLAKYASKKIGVSEETGDAIKFGTTLLSSIVGFKPLMAAKSKNLYSKATELGAKENIKPAPLREYFNKQLSSYHDRPTDPGSPEMIKKISDYVQRLGPTNITADKLQGINKSINASIGASRISQEKEGLKNLLKHVKQFYKGTKARSWKPFQQANDIVSSIKDAEKMKPFLKSLGLGGLGTGAKLLISGLTTGLAGLGTGAATLAGTTLVPKAIDYLRKVGKLAATKEGGKELTKLLAAATARKPTAARAALKKLDKLALKTWKPEAVATGKVYSFGKDEKPRAVPTGRVFNF